MILPSWEVDTVLAKNLAQKEAKKESFDSFLVSEDEVIFLVCTSSELLSTRVNDFGQGGHYTSSSLMYSSTAFQESIMLARLRMLIEIRSSDLFFKHFRVHFMTNSSYYVHYQNCSSW